MNSEILCLPTVCGVGFIELFNNLQGSCDASPDYSFNDSNFLIFEKLLKQSKQSRAKSFFIFL